MEQREGESLEDAINRARGEAETPQTPWWDEAETAFVGGKVLEVATIDGQHGEFKAITLEMADGEKVKVGAMRKALAEKVAERDPQVGDVMTFEYLGERESKTSGFKYHAYAVGHIPADEV